MLEMLKDKIKLDEGEAEKELLLCARKVTEHLIYIHVQYLGKGLRKERFLQWQ